MIVINFKAYSHSTGANAIRLAKVAEEVAAEAGVEIIVCPTAVDLKEVCDIVGIDVYAQHIDNIDPGPHTGYLSAQLMHEKGVKGTLLNHAEHRLDWNTLIETVEKVKREKLNVIVCADDVDLATQQMSLFPDAIALEIPELIGGKISIAKADPQIIRDAVNAIGEGKVLVGAGVRSTDDIKAALDLGAKGVLIASEFDLSENAKQKLLSLAKAFL